MKNYKEIFNPSKITISGKSKIVSTASGKYVIKEKNKDIKNLYKYLSSRSFSNYPNVIDEYDNNYVYEYLSDISSPINQKCEDMASLLASLHNKTSFYKTIVKDDIKKLYEDILNNILYFESYYHELFDRALNESYIRPSYYLLIKYESKINNLILFLKQELEKWYQDIVDHDKERVVYCHNNLSIDHFISSDNPYFISWDNYTIDTPVLDLINLYHNDYNKYDFTCFFSTYLGRFELLKEEKRLLFIIISLPNITYFKEDEIKNTIKVGKFIDYIEKTEKLLKDYYFKETN